MTTTTEELRARLSRVVENVEAPSALVSGASLEQLEHALSLVIDEIDNSEVEGSVLIGKNRFCRQLAEALELHEDDADEVLA